MKQNNYIQYFLALCMIIIIILLIMHYIHNTNISSQTIQSNPKQSSQNMQYTSAYPPAYPPAYQNSYANPYYDYDYDYNIYSYYDPRYWFNPYNWWGNNRSNSYNYYYNNNNYYKKPHSSHHKKHSDTIISSQPTHKSRPPQNTIHSGMQTEPPTIPNSIPVPVPEQNQQQQQQPPNPTIGLVAPPRDSNFPLPSLQASVSVMPEDVSIQAGTHSGTLI
uniref:Uncharacterized protein n=1 Tax=viral metagenome TaxID=1070528 RepID=A0A6C0EYD3_9ZZZZ